MEVTMLSFKRIANDSAKLTILESNRDIPFEVKRVYYIHGAAEGARRGFHAHKNLEQVYICISGSCKVSLDDGRTKADVLLDNPSEGLLFGKKAVWREIFDFSNGAVLLVLASEYYDELEYIRDYDEFVKFAEMNE